MRQAERASGGNGNGKVGKLDRPGVRGRWVQKGEGDWERPVDGDCCQPLMWLSPTGAVDSEGRDRRFERLCQAMYISSNRCPWEYVELAGYTCQKLPPFGFRNGLREGLVTLAAWFCRRFLLDSRSLHSG